MNQATNEANKQNGDGWHSLYVSGVCAGPLMGIGMILVSPGGEVLPCCAFMGRGTLLSAHYESLFQGLRTALNRNVRRLTIYLDNAPMVKQLRGECQIGADHIWNLYRKAVDRLKEFEQYSLNLISPAENQEARTLAAEALDGRGSARRGRAA